jgi:hypothetical protein
MKMIYSILELLKVSTDFERYLEAYDVFIKCLMRGAIGHELM